MTERQKTTRPGIRTTEFWLALAVCIGGACAAIYVDEDWAKVAGLASSTLVAAGYSFCRQGVKRVEAAGIVAAAERYDVMKIQAEAARHEAEAAAARKGGKGKCLGVF